MSNEHVPSATLIAWRKWIEMNQKGWREMDAPVVEVGSREYFLMMGAFYVGWKGGVDSSKG